jgi:hypothetical protein
MGAHITLSERDQHALTIALQLEMAGYTEAATYLRGTIEVLRGISWTDLPRATSREGWEELFRYHRGSLPPTPPSP